MDDVPSPSRAPDLAGVKRALHKISEVVPRTPLLPLEIDGLRIWCKADSLQPMGAFKLRGGWHRLTDLSEEQREKGVVAFSSGNHAQGVAWAAQKLGISATIVMPADAPAAKIEGTRRLGADIVFYDRMTESREAISAAIAAERGSVLVPSFDDPWVVEGQGSMGLEIADQLGRAPDLVVTPCGGGGLAAGLALALPEARIIVAEPEGWDDMRRSLELGRIVPVEPNPPPTACDAIQTLRVAELTFDILLARRANGVAVSEAEVGAAMRLAKEKLDLTIEPGGAAALAAILAGKVEPTGETVVILSGGNVDPETFTAMTGL